MGAGLTRGPDLLGKNCSLIIDRTSAVCLFAALWVTAKREDEESPIAAAPRAPGGGPDLHRHFHSL